MNGKVVGGRIPGIFTMALLTGTGAPVFLEQPFVIIDMTRRALFHRNHRVGIAPGSGRELDRYPLVISGRFSMAGRTRKSGMTADQLKPRRCMAECCVFQVSDPAPSFRLMARGAIRSKGALVNVFMARCTRIECDIHVLSKYIACRRLQGLVAALAVYIRVPPSKSEPGISMIEQGDLFPRFRIMAAIAIRFGKLILMGCFGKMTPDALIGHSEESLFQCAMIAFKRNHIGIGD